MTLLLCLVLQDYGRAVQDLGSDLLETREKAARELVGAAGDTAALPTLRDIVQGDPKNRCTYHAINAVTRLVGTHVRGPSVEDMDVEAVRPRVLKLLEK